MTEDVRVYFAFRSPYSRLGLHMLARAGLKGAELEKAGITGQLIPFTGPPDGTDFLDPTSSRPKLLYYMLDVLRMTARMGLPLGQPKPFEVDFTPANRAFVAADRAGRGMAFALAVSDARWGESQDISDPAILAACADAADWDGFDAVAEDSSLDAILVEHRALIKRDQVFGVPFVVRGKQKYWGHDRMALFLEDLAADLNP